MDLFLSKLLPNVNFITWVLGFLDSWREAIDLYFDLPILEYTGLGVIRFVSCNSIIEKGYILYISLFVQVILCSCWVILSFNWCLSLGKKRFFAEESCFSFDREEEEKEDQKIFDAYYL